MSTEEPGTDKDLAPTPHEFELLQTVQKWVVNEAKFNGRTDEDFLLMFLRGCELDTELTKSTITLYYENRMKIPHWFAKRNLLDPKINSLIHLKTTSVLIDNESLRHPTVVITKLSKIGPNLSNFDAYWAMYTVMNEVIMRRKHTRLYGVIWILDSKDCPWWFSLRLGNPFVVKNFINSFYLGVPNRVRAVISLNTSPMTSAFLKLLIPFLSNTLQQNLHWYGCDFTEMLKHVAKEALPDEYGGCSGPISKHEDAFIEELLAFNDYLLEDDKYGF